MISALFALGFGLFAVVAVGVFALNANTPLQLGPLPFFGSAALSLICLAALVARHLTWR